MPFGKGSPGRQWSMILAVAALSRAASYYFRPPLETATSEVFTGEIPYDVWAVILVVGATLVVAGVAKPEPCDHWSRWLAFAGHVLLCFTYAFYTLSVVYASLFLGDPWAGVVLLAIVTYLHDRRIRTIGAHLGRQ